MVDIKKVYGTDKVKEKEGVLHDLGDGLKIRIARIGNPNYQKRFEALSKPHRRALRKGSLSNEIAEELLIKCMSETIVLDWEGIEENGVEIPYSRENAVRILTDYHDLREHINDIANEMEGYKQEDEEEAIDNLKK